jgi:hypothetical protein
MRTVREIREAQSESVAQKAFTLLQSAEFKQFTDASQMQTYH